MYVCLCDVCMYVSYVARLNQAKLTLFILKGNCLVDLRASIYARFARLQCSLVKVICILVFSACMFVIFLWNLWVPP